MKALEFNMYCHRKFTFLTTKWDYINYHNSQDRTHLEINMKRIACLKLFYDKTNTLLHQWA